MEKKKENEGGGITRKQLEERILQLREKRKQMLKNNQIEKKVASQVVDYLFTAHLKKREKYEDEKPSVLLSSLPEEWLLDDSLLFDITHLQNPDFLGMKNDDVLYVAACCGSMKRKPFSTCQHIYITGTEIKGKEKKESRQWISKYLDFHCCSPVSDHCQLCKKPVCMLHIWTMSRGLRGSPFLAPGLFCEDRDELWCVDCVLRQMKWSEMWSCHQKFGEDKKKAEKYKKQIRQKNHMTKHLLDFETDGSPHMAFILRVFDAFKHQRAGIPVFDVVGAKKSFVPHFGVRERNLQNRPIPYLNRWLFTQMDFIHVPIVEGLSLEQQLSESWVVNHPSPGLMQKYILFFYTTVFESKVVIKGGGAIGASAE